MTDFDKRAQDHVEGRPDDVEFVHGLRFVPADPADTSARRYSDALNAALLLTAVKVQPVSPVPFRFGFVEPVQPFDLSGFVTGVKEHAERVNNARWTRQSDSQTGSEGWVEITDEPS